MAGELGTKTSAALDFLPNTRNGSETYQPGTLHPCLGREGRFALIVFDGDLAPANGQTSHAGRRVPRCPRQNGRARGTGSHGQQSRRTAANKVPADMFLVGGN